MEAVGIYDLNDELLMSVFYDSIRSDEILFQVKKEEDVDNDEGGMSECKKEQLSDAIYVSVKVNYDCGELVEGILNVSLLIVCVLYCMTYNIDDEYFFRF